MRAAVHIVSVDMSIYRFSVTEVYITPVSTTTHEDVVFPYNMTTTSNSVQLSKATTIDIFNSTSPIHGVRECNIIFSAKLFQCLILENMLLHCEISLLVEIVC